MHDDPDDQFEGELRAVAASVDPVPSDLLRIAIGAFTWRTAEAELAALVFDSLTDQDEAAAVRGPGESRMLSFEAGDLTIEVEVTGTGATRRLIGQLAPAGQALIDIRHGGETASVRADELGRFTAEAVAAGPVSLRCSALGQPGAEPGALPGGAVVVTDWVTI